MSESYASLTVHALHNGRALCGKKGAPNTWAPNERWVSIDEWKSEALSPFAESTLCPACHAAVLLTMKERSQEALAEVSRELHKLTESELQDPRTLYLTLRTQARILKYGSRKCSKCSRLLETEEDPYYWADLCDEHRKHVDRRVIEWITKGE